MKKNLDSFTVKSFGDEWSRFDQSALPSAEANRIFDEYFLFSLGISFLKMLWVLTWGVARVGGQNWW